MTGPMLNKSLFSSFSTQENDFKDSIVFKFIYVLGTML